MNIVDFIAEKRDGGEHSGDAIREFILGVAAGTVPDYQAAAWLMATYLRGMTRRETLDLTLAMRDSGRRIDLSSLTNGPSLDKHSTGGVGDKTTLVVVPILAAAGIPMLKMSGRALGFSGGTIDKLESIPGFRTDLSIAEAMDIVSRVGAALIAQSGELAPADKALYGLRDVTATIECIPLIASSIMSKKLAAGGERIVLDVKCGEGAFMKSQEQAMALARELVDIGNGAGVPTVAVLSRMDEPLGHAVGNALEVREAIDILTGRYSADTSPNSADSGYVDLCIELAAHGLFACGLATSVDEGLALGRVLLDSGQAAEKFSAIVAAQRGPEGIRLIQDSLPSAPHIHAVQAPVSGVVVGLNAGTIGKVATEMGAGRLAKGDVIDPTVGIVLQRKIGSHVTAGDELAFLHLNERGLGSADQYSERILSAYEFADEVPDKQDSETLVIGVVR